LQVDVGLILRLHSALGMLQTTAYYFWTTWHQTRAFLISVNNKSDFLAGLTILKRRGVWAD